MQQILTDAGQEVIMKRTECTTERIKPLAQVRSMHSLPVTGVLHVNHYQFIRDFVSETVRLSYQRQNCSSLHM